MNRKQIEQLKAIAADRFTCAVTAEELEEVRVKYLGRKGEVTQLLRSLKELSLAERKKIGPQLQALKEELGALFTKQRKSLVGKMVRRRAPDITAPAKKVRCGYLHPLTLVEQDIRNIFRGMNFSIIDGPEAESEYYNFDALNIPPDHPARDMWDTFWLKAPKGKEKKTLLRTHTSPVQVRYMETHKPPFQIVVPGRAFRYEATDATHEVNFYQLEGLMVGRSVSLAHYKYIIGEFLSKYFAKKIEFRFRPSYFPFVEPGLEVDIKFARKGKRAEWLELMGAGMVHPRVFEYAHYNPRDWQGFAFGMGIDRLAMIKYNIPDVRLFFSGDVRFVRQF